MPSPRSGAAPQRRGSNAAPSPPRGGWGAVAAQKKKSEAAKNKRSNNNVPYLDIKNKFLLKDGETAIIQFINDEPVCADGCTIPPNFDWYVSRKEVDRSCPLIDAGLKPVWRAGFKVLDHRGNWSKDDNDFSYDKPVERYWLVSNTVASQLFTLTQRKGIPLSEMVLEVTRTGSDKTTTYNFEMASKKGKLLEPVDLSDYEETLPSLKKAMKPLSVEELEEILGVSEDDDTTYPLKGKGKAGGKPVTKSRRRDDDDEEDDDDRHKQRPAARSAKSRRYDDEEDDD